MAALSELMNVRNLVNLIKNNTNLTQDVNFSEQPKFNVLLNIFKVKSQMAEPKIYFLSVLNSLYWRI